MSIYRLLFCVALSMSMLTIHPRVWAAAYNFTYKIAGDVGIAPVQAFDDGEKIYIQFRDVKQLPAIFADTPAGQVLLRLGIDYDIEVPFVVIRRLESELIFVVRQRRAFLRYVGMTEEVLKNS
ncbi:TrbG/VirB9 family P-type conjugative transfer protein [Herbaspirillum autotrophicum]|uniref:TrbG/VirB9 family P-type conjugative transfer protein n=1 Tax=Herbaspirillum autotrophicum TaxID=180195 RepID=UPI00067C13E6|nr:TrbG/VirB9 family P-type conjugative transfer protein [Herbaspirillum autotrophicum]